MFSGAHVIVYSRDAAADRAFLRDVLGFTHVDAGEGWLIFGLPPAELAVHPDDRNDAHQLFFMCEDIQATVLALAGKKVSCSPVVDRGWGLLTELRLPGGGVIGLYQPRHPRPEPVRPGPAGGA